MSSQVNLFLRGCTCTNHFFAKFQGAPQADVCRPEHRWTMVVWIRGLLRSMSNTPGAIYSMSYDICYGCTTVFQKKPKYHADLVMSLEMLHSSLEVFFAGFETQLAFGRRPLEKTGRCGFLRPLNHFQDATCMILLFWLKRTLFKAPLWSAMLLVVHAMGNMILCRPFEANSKDMYLIIYTHIQLLLWWTTTAWRAQG